ncbi:sorbitol dehydrogenase [bacterium BMS3Abin07]|nr:sorbitol dehydrogenase [bacterium BMS3Abin07]GBE32021.1 sorbitol dehydrogenase [bacterium BMS3Bbin05]HDO21635.1 alcohol dehydrogenase [Nitrospirota bacterium]HDZ88733.1 alcohol dehydrogenase [Nitrospirota bacterium]
MLSAYLVNPGAIEIREVPIPEPGPAEIVVKIISALTCGTDLKAYVRGHSLIPMPGPFGHEFSGIVHSAGKGVKKFKESDEIMPVHSAPCNNCSYCDRGIHNLCRDIMKNKVLGAFAGYIRIPGHVVRQNCYKKPGELSFDEAAMLEPLSCIVHPYSRIKLRETENAVIIGAGPVGLLHLLFLKSRGIKTIISDLNEDRLEFANSIGADILSAPAGLADTIHDNTKGMGADIVVECTGLPGVWQESVNYVRRGGIVILFGGCADGTSVRFGTHMMHYDEITLMGSFHFTPYDVKNAYSLLRNRTINAGPLITDVIALKDIKTAFENLKNGKGIKYSVRP